MLTVDAIVPESNDYSSGGDFGTKSKSARVPVVLSISWISMYSGNDCVERPQ